MRMQSIVRIQKQVPPEMNIRLLLFLISDPHLLLLCHVPCNIKSCLRPWGSRLILYLSIRDRFIHSVKFTVSLNLYSNPISEWHFPQQIVHLAIIQLFDIFFPQRKLPFQGTLEY